MKKNILSVHFLCLTAEETLSILQVEDVKLVYLFHNFCLEKMSEK